MTPEQFMECFGVVAEAEGGIQRLREVVIEFSMSGRLTDSEKWRTKKLREIALDFRNGISKRNGDGKPMVVLRLADIVGTSTATTNLRKIPLSAIEADLYRLERSDLLVIRVNGSKHLVGRFILCDLAQGYAYSDHLIRVRLGPEMLPEFLSLATRSREAKAYLDLQTKTTAGQHTVNQVGLGGLTVPVPPLAEQKRIVAKVDQLMAMLDDLEQRQEKKRSAAIHVSKASLDSLVNAEDPDQLARAWERVSKNFGVVTGTGSATTLSQAVLTLAVRGELSCNSTNGGASANTLVERAFAERKSYPRLREYERWSDKEITVSPRPTWALARLDEVCHFIDYRGRTPEKVETGIRLITAKNVRMGLVNPHPAEFIREDDYESWMNRGLPISGDVLFTTEAPLGNVAQLIFSEKIALAQRVVTLHPLGGILGRYLMFLLMSPPFQKRIWEESSGVTARGIKAARLKRIVISIPGVIEQQQIVDIIDRLFFCLDQVRDRHERREVIKGSMVAAVAHVGL